MFVCVSGLKIFASLIAVMIVNPRQVVTLPAARIWRREGQGTDCSFSLPLGCEIVLAMSGDRVGALLD